MWKVAPLFGYSTAIRLCLITFLACLLHLISCIDQLLVFGTFSFLTPLLTFTGTEGPAWSLSTGLTVIAAYLKFAMIIVWVHLLVRKKGVLGNKVSQELVEDFIFSCR